MILGIVSLLHGVLIAVLLTRGPIRGGARAAPQALVVTFLPTANLVKITADNLPPNRLTGAATLSVAPPQLGSLGQSPLASGTLGNGAGVDWTAEAHRALQAFEIRHNEAAGSEASASPVGDDAWWPREPHRAGEQYKTAGGDWIVWINASCYQVASAGSTYGAGTAGGQTVCPRREPSGAANRAAAD